MLKFTHECSVCGDTCQVTECSCYLKRNEHTVIVRVSRDLLPQLRQWSEPLQVMVTGENENELELLFRRVE